MSQAANSSTQTEWLGQIEISQGDGPLVLSNGQSVSVLRHELCYLVERGKAYTSSATATECEELRKKTVGLAFSGGGIRSATFGLGVLEALKEINLLKQFQFLSTVSGGGYLGAWFSANCYRAPARNFADPDADWNGAIGFLRRYSNYLSPHLGFGSADTWSMVTIWLRNAMLVQFTIILGIAAVLLVPRILEPLFDFWYESGDLRWTAVGLYLLAVVGIAANQRRLLADSESFAQQPQANVQDKGGLLSMRPWPWEFLLSAGLFGAAWIWGWVTNFAPFTNDPISIPTAFVLSVLLLFASYCLLPAGVRLVNSYAKRRDKSKPPKRVINYTQPWVQGLVVLPLMVAAVLVSAVLWGQALDLDNPLSGQKTFGKLFWEAFSYWPLPLVVAFVSFLFLAWFSILKKKSALSWAIVVIAPVAAGLTLHTLLCVTMLLVHMWAANSHDNEWKAFVWVPAMLLYVFSVSIVVLLGILGRQTTEAVREWWSRLGAWLVIYGSVWMLVAVAAIYGPLWGALMFSQETWHGTSISLAWILTTVAGLITGKSGQTSGNGLKTTGARVMEWVTRIAPYVYIAGLLIAIATALNLIIVQNSPPLTPLVTASSLAHQHWTYLADSSWRTAAIVLLVTLVLFGLFAWRVDINEFSLNSFYRSRLVRCYLGATRPPQERKPQNFTGFDEKDDLQIADLKASNGPLHIVNCALNLGGSSDLALHTRHSASFTITPLSIGSYYRSGDSPGEKFPIGFRETSQYGCEDATTSLGKAISVSGAAASPNMGYHSSPMVAFVLTMFDARLGWWFARPRDNEPVTSASPKFSLRYLLAELFASADDRSDFVMVSDGGHFENLGVYELIRRRCKVIVASDAECDPQMHFEGLGTLKRMCEVDFGVTIDIDVSALVPDPNTGWSKSRCAVGKIIYDDKDATQDGTFIYLKASMSGHEDEAVLQYKAAHPSFPHESTGNQFYGEDQFESYRKLGYQIALRALRPVASERTGASAQTKKVFVVEDLVQSASRLESIWTPVLAASTKFPEHSDRLMRLWDQWGYGKAVSLFSPRQEQLLAKKWPETTSADDFRTAYYVSSQIIQLMENVYLDLDFENVWLHPDNAGWRSQFMSWAESPAVQETWRLTSHMFGQRFRYFCSRHLHLPVDD